jgi:hypothetical protein
MFYHICLTLAAIYSSLYTASMCVVLNKQTFILYTGNRTLWHQLKILATTGVGVHMFRPENDFAAISRECGSLL